MEVYHREIPDVVYRQRKMIVPGTTPCTLQGFTPLAIRPRVPRRACIISRRAWNVILSVDSFSGDLRLCE